MFMKDFVARIYGNKIRCCVTLIVLLLPVLDIVIYCCNLIRSGGSTIAPRIWDIFSQQYDRSSGSDYTAVVSSALYIGYNGGGTSGGPA